MYSTDALYELYKAHLVHSPQANHHPQASATEYKATHRDCAQQNLQNDIYSDGLLEGQAAEDFRRRWTVWYRILKTCLFNAGTHLAGLRCQKDVRPGGMPEPCNLLRLHLTGWRQDNLRYSVFDTCVAQGRNQLVFVNAWKVDAACARKTLQLRNRQITQRTLVAAEGEQDVIRCEPIVFSLPLLCSRLMHQLSGIRPKMHSLGRHTLV
mmetsp:Transcript_68654/g.129494  ORF Transcript_68654/g.129494 Transcript_68654/m.129494 type:complete len:209 (-) Transcript_68654:812-1438(-)